MSWCEKQVLIKKSIYDYIKKINLKKIYINFTIKDKQNKYFTLVEYS
jgi:hypothetical protein